MSSYFRTSVFVFAVALALMPGCGGSGNYVWVTGKLLKGGAPYKPPEGQMVTLTFYGMETRDAQGKKSTSVETFQALLNPEDGSYKVIGPQGEGIPPGKYRICIFQRYTREAFAALKNVPKGMFRDSDVLKDQFGPMNTPIIREIEGKVDLVIDMDKPTEGAAPAA